MLTHLSCCDLMPLTGRKDRAFERLYEQRSCGSQITYGHLRLIPLWDHCAADRVFEAIVLRSRRSSNQT